MRLPTARRSSGPDISGQSATPRGAAGVLALALAAAVLVGCSSEEKQPQASPEPSPTPIANLNTTAMQVPRIDFCQLVPDAAVADALGAKPDDAASYGNGDVEALGESTDRATRDVLHEIGCAWRTDDGAVARAWVFARPVTPAFAQTVVRSGGRTAGCRAVSGPPFGKPSTTQQCRLSDGRMRVRHAGLFGQTWLSCEVTNPRGVPLPEVRERADAWCVEVATSVNTAR